MNIDQSFLNVLLIGADTEEKLTVRRLLNSINHKRYILHETPDFSSGLSKILSNQYDVCFVDHRLEDDRGLELIHSANRNESETPLILLLESNDQNMATASLEAGAMDYLCKEELNLSILDRTIRNAIERKKNEIQLKKLNQKLQYFVQNDLLTGLPNRTHFFKEFTIISERCTRNKHSLAVLFIDLDDFKNVNKVYGHSHGDLILQQVAMRLLKILRKVDHIYRVGGDEFVVVIEGQLNDEKISNVAAKIIEIISTPFTLDTQTVRISTSIGIATMDGEQSTPPDQLIKAADIAMDQAKAKGRNNFQFYHADSIH